ncbi:MAG: hypothetical protein AAF389_06770 [Gemmatimonadota bacterium]
MSNSEERRSDFTVREHVRTLLTLIRDFYTTCHMVSVGQLEPAKAKAKAKSVEEQLSGMMTEILERLEQMDEDDASSDGGTSDG